MIAENIQNIGENLRKACAVAGRDPKDVQLIAVSKTFGPEAVREAYAAGMRDFGENYVQELVGKHEAVTDSGIRWHFIGHLQTNKVKYIADWIHLVHSVDSTGLAAELEKRAAKAERIQEVLIEVNTSEEATKFGIPPPLALELIAAAAQHPHLRVRGLMTIGPFTDDTERSRASFRQLRQLFDEANRQQLTAQRMDVLSMGMTHDFRIAVQEGATMVRIGTAIFGTRTRTSQ